MKRREEQQEGTLVINVNLTRGLVALLALALLTAALLGYLAWGQREVAASSPQARLAAPDGAQQYYLTKGTYGGAGANLRCADGYHMASLWEILDPSNLKYNTDLGRTRDDSGAGPTTFRGWVRTGYMSDNTDTIGRANCNAWSTTTGHGTSAALPNTWTAGWEDMHVWNVQAWPCNDVNPVWCVED